MLRKLSRFNFVLFALAALAYTDEAAGKEHASQTAGGGGTTGAALQREDDFTKSTPTDFAAFCGWINRHLKAGNITVTYDNRSLKVDELLADGKLRLVYGGESIYAPFADDLIDQLMPQIV